MFKNEFSCGALVRIGLLIGTGWLLQAQTQPPNNVTRTESQPESSSVPVTSKAQSNTSNVVPPLDPKKSHATRIGVAQPVVHFAELGSLIKAKTEDRFEYRLVTPTSDTPVLANAERAKAKNDGDDIITQLVTQADTDILANLGRKR